MRLVHFQWSQLATKRPGRASCCMASMGLAMGTISVASAQTSNESSANIVVNGALIPSRDSAPNFIGSSIDRTVLDHANTTTPEDSLRYLPNIQVRQRFIGDTGSGVAVRGTNGFQTARTLVTLDGIPISNLLGNTYVYAPLWGMIAPDEIERVDTMYGPFSAKYGGNTLGAGIFIKTRLPEKLEGGVDLTYGNQQFNAQSTSNSLDTVRLQAQLGDRQERVAWSLYYDHLDSSGQPLYFAALPVSSGSTSVAGTPVSGALSDRDATGTNRYIVGSSGGTGTHSDLIKAKLAIDANASTRLLLTAAYRDLHYTSLSPETYLRDANGGEVMTGRASIAGRSYDLSSQLGFREQDVRLRDLIVGATLTSRLSNTLDAELSASTYNVLSGETRQGYPAGNGAQVIATDHQGWANAAARFGWTPGLSPLFGSRIGFGGDYAQYWTQTSTYASPDWRNGARGTFAERSAGKTETVGLYVEDRWNLAKTLSLTAGLRYDHWRAFDGLRQLTMTGLNYPARSADGWSPKGALRWTPGHDWAVQFQAARAYRSPTVTELFQSATSGGVLTQSDPNLRPERATTLDLGVTRDLTLAGGTLRLGGNIFQERVRDTLYSQQNAFTGSVYYQNIGMVRTRGIELNAEGRHLVRGLFDVNGSIARQQGRITENANLPITVGNEMPRVPRWRWSALATAHPVPQMDASVGVRHEGAQYNDIFNSDGRRGGFGYADGYTFVEAKLAYRLTPQLQGSVGVDNLFDQVRYIYHPYPGRTVLMTLKWRPL